MKICYKCNQNKSLNQFYKNKAQKDGLTGECKDCKKKLAEITRKIRASKLWSNPNALKYCTKCRTEKQLVHFKKALFNKDGYESFCKECNKDYHKNYQLRYRNQNKEKISLYAKELHKSLKQEILSHYGKICNCCGESNFHFLTIDHINNDGNNHRKDAKCGSGNSFYKWLKKNNFPKGQFQTLCYNCNMAKRVTGICPHQHPQALEI